MEKEITEVDTEGLFQVWAVAYARKLGYTASDDDAASISAETVSEGCCELCYSTTAELILTVGKRRIYLGTDLSG